MKGFKILLPALCFFVATKNLQAQDLVNENEPFNMKQRSIVAISAFTANGDLQKLTASLNEGLDEGLTINEIKEVIVQLYAYAGFPRSLNALNTFMEVLKERKAKGIGDSKGKEPSQMPTEKSKLEFGTEMQTKLVGQPIKGEVYDFAPAIDQFLKEHLFGDIFGRDNLDWKTRELATISALAAIGGVENQLRSHFRVGMYNGLTGPQLSELVSIIEWKVGKKEGEAAGAVLQSVLQPTNTKRNKENNTQEFAENAIFPSAEKVRPEHFTGTAWINRLVAADETKTYSVGNVVFEPGARTAWHTHPAGQILVVLDGKGWYQEKGKPARLISEGDVVVVPSSTVHWHGAAMDTPFTHLAITNIKDGSVKWLQHVTDVEYNTVNKH